MRNDHIINFMSCDCVHTASLGHELINQSLLKLSDLKIGKPELGQVISSRNRKRLIFSVFIKEHFDDKTYAKNIETAIEALKDAMNQLINLSERSANSLIIH